MAPRRPPTKLETAEAWWPFLSRIFAFFIGVAMLGYATVLDANHSAALLMAGIGLTGVPLAPVAEKLLDRLPGGKD